jgi:Aerotolerance regulator N-terminal/von Willebrand factor type A domain
MSFLTPWWLLLGGFAIPIVALHMLRPRRQRVEVSSTWLWKPAEVHVTARRPWQKLRKSWPLLLQLLAVALLAVGAAQPVTNSPTSFGRHTVFIVDNSVSMSSRDVTPNRFAELQKKAKSLRGKLPGSALASIITTDGTVRLSTSDDKSAFDRVINRLEPSTGANRIDRASLLAKGLQTAESDTGFVLISDGQLTEPEQRLLPSGVRFEPIGTSAANVSISDPIVEPRTEGSAVTATVTNRSNTKTEATVLLSVDGKETAKQRVAVGPTATESVSFPVASGEQITLRLAELTTKDHLSADDRLFVTAGERRKINVQLVTSGDPASIFIERALQALPNVKLTAGASTAVSPKTDLLVFDRVQPPVDLAAPAILIAPPSGFGPITLKAPAKVDFPIPTLVRSSNSLLVGLDLSSIVIESSQSIDPGDTDVLVGAPNAALLVAGRTERNPFVYWSFSPSDSTIALDLAFPVLIDRMVTELGGASVPGGAVDIGTTLAPADEQRTLTSPTKKAVTLGRGEPSPPLSEAGFWSIRGKDKSTQLIAVNTPSRESNIAPQGTLAAAPPSVEKNTKKGTSRASQLRWFMMALLALIAAEWWAVRRKVGVRAGQWKLAQGVRAVVAGLALFALIAPIIRTPTRNVATVFAVDVSDSLGPGGRRDAVAFVEDALSKMPKSARAGVIVFGGSAQVTAAVQRQLSLGDVSNVIDASNTDLAGALRLASAASPSDSARRIVLVSDGRRTIGDDAAAAEELADAGIRLDVAIAGRPGTADVAVDSFRVPARAQQGEKLVLRANLRATEAMRAEVILKADGKAISRENVELTAGDNPWSVELGAASQGVSTYSLEVLAQGDTVVQNDVGYAATAIDGTTRVLVLRGDSAGYEKGGNGANEIAAALQASGLEVTTKRAGELDGLEDLAGVSAVVLVDVHRREFNEGQVDVLTGAVRELGVGMTVIGGTNSFGSGGYLGSKLEELLPVVSEVSDPKRRSPVAQAIIIDTSGSMGIAVDGSRTALDLAKAGALGAVGALQDGDKVGVAGVDDDREWVMDVQDLPSYSEAEKQISKLNVGGGTVIEGSLTEAATKLSAVDASVRHILVLSDGYTSDSAALIKEAGVLRAQGFTISVVGAGTDIEPSFGQVAAAGGGRFVPGGDFANLPAIFVEETQTVARNLVNEGDFSPKITSSAAAVRDLQTAPILKGFQATTPRPTARTALRVGPFDDPLLSSWQAGLGKVTTWSSDGGQRWAGGWAGMEQPFWSNVVKDTILRGGSGTVRASIDDGRLTIRAVGPEWREGATALATVRTPSGEPVTVQLRRTGDGAYVGEAEAPEAGTYAVGVTVNGGGGAVFKGGSTAIRGYSAEYEPGNIDRARLEQLSKRTEGRGIIKASQVFDTGGLVNGKRVVNLAPWLLAAASLLWLLAIVLWRMPLGKPVLAGGKSARQADKARAKDAKAKTQAFAAKVTKDRDKKLAASANNATDQPTASSSSKPKPAAPVAPVAKVINQPKAGSSKEPLSDLTSLVDRARERRR